MKLDGIISKVKSQVSSSAGKTSHEDGGVDDDDDDPISVLLHHRGGHVLRLTNTNIVGCPNRQRRENIEKICMFISDRNAERYPDRHITQLYIDDTGVGDDFAVRFAVVLREDRALKIIHLERNRIGKVGMCAIAEALGVNRCVEKLFISRNHQGREVDDVYSSLVAVDNANRNNVLAELGYDFLNPRCGDIATKGLLANYVSNNHDKEPTATKVKFGKVRSFRNPHKNHCDMTTCDDVKMEDVVASRVRAYTVGSQRRRSVTPPPKVRKKITKTKKTKKRNPPRHSRRRSATPPNIVATTTTTKVKTMKKRHSRRRSISQGGGERLAITTNRKPKVRRAKRKVRVSRRRSVTPPK